MQHDPFYQAILRAFEERRLDPTTFEECAADLLRTRFPGLTPVPGGNDAGMDGAIADGAGAPFPLVTTTGMKVAGNLRRNLSEYVERGEGRKKVAVATSQPLTPQKRRNLHKIAAEFEFELVDIVDRTGMCQLLARDPEWARELLGVEGRPSTLSAWPLSTRPLLGQRAIGMEDEIAWLTNCATDCVVVGQPGSGKTFLSFAFARDGRWLFVIGDDFDAITTDLRRLDGPAVLVVDDAHARIPLLERFVHDRRARGASYRIVATVWPGEAADVQSALGLGSDSVRRLPLLTRPQIVEVIHQCGVGGPDEIVAELVHQADGLPGRAASLADLCLNRDVNAVMRGEALAASLRVALERRVGQHAFRCLAAFGLGGDDGVELRTVAETLGIPYADAQRLCTELYASGLLAEVRRARLSVWPVRLRHVVVRDIFFCGAASLDPAPVLATTSDHQQSALTLLHVRHLGGSVEPGLLDTYLAASGSKRVWSIYACLGPTEARDALARFPQFMDGRARPALDRFPEIVLPALMQRAVGDLRPLHSNLGHPLRIVQDWVREVPPGNGEALSRRRVVFDAARTWLRARREVPTATRALVLALGNSWERWSTPIENENVVNGQFGLLSSDEIRALGAWWDEVLPDLPDADAAAHDALLESLWSWVHPDNRGQPVPEEARREARAVAERMVRDLAHLVAAHRGRIRRLEGIAAAADIAVPHPRDPEFDTLCPPFPDDDHVQNLERLARAANALADAWATEQPEVCAPRLADHVRAIEEAGTGHSRMDQSALAHLASIVREPLRWARAFRDARVAPSVLVDFTYHAAVRNEVGWTELLTQMCESPEGRFAAARVALALPRVDDALLERIFVEGAGLGRLVEWAGVRGAISADTLIWLLRHTDDDLAGSAVLCEWHSPPTKHPRAEVLAEWTRNVPRARRDSHWVKDILKSDPALAEAWVRHWMADEVHRRESDSEIVTTAIEMLNVDVRRALLRDITRDTGADLVVRELVGRDEDLYVALRAREDLRACWHDPLEGAFDEVGARFVQLALEAGSEPDRVAAALSCGAHSWRGPESAYCDERAKQYDTLLRHPDVRVQEVGRIASRWLTERADAARQRERDAEVHGDGRRAGYRIVGD